MELAYKCFHFVWNPADLGNEWFAKDIICHKFTMDPWNGRNGKIFVT